MQGFHFGDVPFRRTLWRRGMVGIDCEGIRDIATDVL